jgi:hypothetical protein
MMKATIDGITVEGTPEEIHKFRELTMKTKPATDWFNKGGTVVTSISGKNITKILTEELKLSARSFGVIH